MRILITGGTGLIGRQLCKVLLAERHQLTVLSRKPETVAVKCGSAVQAMAKLGEWLPQRTFDAVINLAGEPIVDARWTESRKQVLRDSRIALTEELVQRIAAATQKPSVLLSGSAIGYYGGRGEEELNEDSGAGTDFPARLCVDWEAAALAAEQHGVRVCLLRTGLILSRDGGLLGRMAPPFKLGMGARVGDGKQWMSWIHIDDYVALVLRLLRDEQMRGAFNMTSPEPVTNREFTKTLAAVLRRPAPFVAPSSLLKLSLGESASLLLEGQRVLPTRMLAAGNSFRFSGLEEALKDLFG
ncbi:MAG: TIGR01777 family oxidoreductase [Gammaproteobacteria bacterium]|nr:TIGR01777 family oxidoreductase [Gammaproteobacteria bacterium]MBU1776485.1 TIGR01777 family oxidoreductase [Gammaproteobacteria bacterium]MBU1968169.1 TIGR01777 family oxidoreductase [Gammaproteobacteria bacterium]